MKIKDLDFYRSVRDYLTVYLLEQRVCSFATVKSYREAISLFLEFITKSQGIGMAKIGFETITPEVVSDFLKWLVTDKKSTATTINHRLAVIRAFLKYAGTRNPEYWECYLKIQQIPFRKVQKKLTVNHFDENTLSALLTEPDIRKKTGHRDLFFMILMYDSGARDGEMLSLHPCDVIPDLKAPYVILRGKGNKIRTVPLMKKTIDHFGGYLKRYQLDPRDEGPLFFTIIHGKRCVMSDDNVARFIRKYALAARLKNSLIPENITPHMFRHSRAIHLYRNGVPLPLISQWLGHSNLETTLVYAYADTEMKRKAIESATKKNHPLYQGEVLYKEGEDEKIREFYGL